MDIGWNEDVRAAYQARVQKGKQQWLRIKPVQKAWLHMVCLQKERSEEHAIIMIFLKKGRKRTAVNENRGAQGG